MLTGTHVTRRVTALVAALLLTAGLAAGCGGGGGGGGDEDGVASIDGSSTENAEADEGDEGGGGPRPDDAEFQDAMLEYAQCMRDHGIDMPDPEFSDDGGVTQMMGEGTGGAGPDGPSDEFLAADEECKPILDEAMPDMEELSPEERAERQDQMVAVAECMRGKGHDMPDPEVNADGGISITRRAPAGGGTPQDEDEFQEDMEACHEEAGLEGPGGGPAPAGGSEG